MSTKRRDKKGRILLSGESQRKNGLYVYQYTAHGKRMTVTSWRLTETDPLPSGKRSCEALRTMEERILLTVGSGLVLSDKSLNDIFDASMDARYGRASDDTKEDYQYRYTKYVRSHALGSMPVKDIQTEDLEGFFMDLEDLGVGNSVIDRLNRIISRTMSYAIKRKIRTDNPCQGVSIDYTAEPVDALTEEETENLLRFVKGSEFAYWYDFIRFILNSGLRIGEAAGFTWSEYNQQEGALHIRQAINTHMMPDGGKITEMDTPKTAAGVREIPVNGVVKSILDERRREQKNHETYGKYKALGVSGFVFLNQSGTYIRRDNFSAVMRRIRAAYNKEEEQNAVQEGREPHLMPPIHPHVLRHTFCTRLCEVETNVSRIKEIMGHSDISVTLNIYNTVTMKAKKETMKKLAI